jgi:DNA mismatch repair protein MutS
LGILDQTVTAMGGRLMAHWLRYPLLDPARIRSRFDAVADAVEQMQTRRDCGNSSSPCVILSAWAARSPWGTATHAT